ncbi:uncharacterized protein LOC121388758 isoform X2 [Gigantopelta aegis]|uniref:uncharacterized protein LOC121388758 isoform X2 n=1 Tax=Gigantopelta aegis TaxID=1735272 RepID=UPI001B88DB81|nr:uncharacterized protein LOC121388758 isoform X2 [Gigantopelta aegis]
MSTCQQTTMEKSWKLLFLYQMVAVMSILFIFIHVMNERLMPMPVIRVNASQDFRYMIYECTGDSYCGGWADRLKGIAMAYLISVMTKRRFGIHITSPRCNITDFLEPNHVDWVVDVDMINDLPSDRFNHVDRSTFLDHASTANFSSILKEDVIFYKGNYEFITALQRNPNHRSELLWTKGRTVDEVFSAILKVLFKLNKKLDTLIREFLQRVRPDKRKSKLVCAQIRMGRNPTIPRDTEVRNTPEGVEAVWKFVRNNLICEHCKFFLSTDSEHIHLKAKSEFPDQIVDIPGEINHIERGSKHGNSCEAMAKVVIDQHVLAHCDSLIISQSGFGIIAAYLRGEKENLYCFIHGKVVPCLPSNIHNVFRKPD